MGLDPDESSAWWPIYLNLRQGLAKRVKLLANGCGSDLIELRTQGEGEDTELERCDTACLEINFDIVKAKIKDGYIENGTCVIIPGRPPAT